MTTADFAIRNIKGDIEDAEQAVERATVWMERMSRELAEAVRGGRDHSCQMGNMMSATCDLGLAVAKLQKYQTVLNFLEDVKNG